ncbi:MAG: hypothetical protein ACI9CA_002247 [Natronomonas sp.]|jgi:hypothetical protein
MGKTATEPRTEDADTATDRRRGGIDVFNHVIVRQPLRPGRTDTLRDRLASWVGNVADVAAGLDCGTSTASALLRRAERRLVAATLGKQG